MCVLQKHKSCCLKVVLLSLIQILHLTLLTCDYYQVLQGSVLVALIPRLRCSSLRLFLSVNCLLKEFCIRFVESDISLREIFYSVHCIVGVCSVTIEAVSLKRTRNAVTVAGDGTGQQSIQNTLSCSEQETEVAYLTLGCGGSRPYRLSRMRLCCMTCGLVYRGGVCQPRRIVSLRGTELRIRHQQGLK